MTTLSRISAAFLFAAACHGNAAVLYGPTQISTSARISDYGTASQTGFRSYDNFTVAAGGSVQKVTWVGFWIDFANPVPAAAPAPDALSWDIAFHADNSGVPGSELLLESFSAAPVSSTFLGTGVFVAGDSYNVSFYQYSVDLTAPFAALPDTEYWVSVLSRSDLYLPAFALRGATGGDDSSYQEQLGAGLSVLSGGAVARDRAIVLEGTAAVPEPGTLVLATVGLVALPLLRGRRL